MQRLLLLIIGFWFLTSMTDPLDNLSFVSGHSANLTIDTINPVNFNYDSARVMRTNTQAGFLIYAIENYHDFKIDFWAVDDDSGIVKVYLSEDGNLYNEIATVVKLTDFGYRHLKSIQPAEKLPERNKFLKIEISGGNQAWKGQIGSVTLIEPKEIRDSSMVFYVDSETGLDTNSGLSAEKAWKTLDRINCEDLIPGDSILLKSGSVFYGFLSPKGSGSIQQSIIIGKYGGDKLPLINSAGYLAGINIENQSNIVVSNLEIISDAGEPFQTEARTKRYGVNVIANGVGEFKNIKFKNLNIHHIFATENVESDGQNPTSNMGMGINISMQNKEAKIANVTIENCKISMTGHTGIKIFGAGDNKSNAYLDSVFILDNQLENIGGPGMVPGRCSNVVVRGNTVNYSGSKADPRMHNRGSGIWPWTSKNVLIEKNKFKHAWGKYDSCGAHIDFNCSNVVVQYNLSYHNAGGFVEILGNDVDCVYRYNISINDGYRKKGVNGALSDGHIIWLSSYVGNGNEPVGANHCKIYNNTIFVGRGIKTGLRFEDRTRDNIIENNIFYVEGELKYENSGVNNTFNKNIWFGNIPVLPFGAGAVFADPKLVNPGDSLPNSYLLKENSPAINTGSDAGVVEFDFWGDTVSGRLPRDRGADESVYSPKLIEINLSAGEGGKIYPSGEYLAPENSDLPVKIYPKPGYVIQNVRVDGISTGAESVYNFQQITQSHTLVAEFFAPADSMVDPLNDFSLVGDFMNMRIQNENPENFSGDPARAQRNRVEPGFITYHFKELKNLEVEFWTYANDLSELKIYVSEDGINFTEMIKQTIRIVKLGSRTKTVYSAMNPIPENTDYLRFEITGGDASWKAQIGSVNLSWWGDEKNTTLAKIREPGDFMIYPNPVSEKLFLKNSSDWVAFEIYSLTGAKIFSGLATSEINVSNLPSGVYLLNLEGKATTRFVKQ